MTIGATAVPVSISNSESSSLCDAMGISMKNEVPSSMDVGIRQMQDVDAVDGTKDPELALYMKVFF